MCLLFYGKMWLFASVSQSGSSGSGTTRSATSAWFARVTQFESITSLYSQTCYGTSMSAYNVTAAQLTGPAIVLVFAIALTLALKRALPLLERRKINVVVSTPATLSVVILLLFSSVTTVAFKLVTCAKITDSNNNVIWNVVFIDGTVECNDSKWKGLIAVIVLLCPFPLVFAAALRWKRLPHNVRDAVCSAYSESRFYWGAVTLFFRLVMSIVFATIREYPSTAALVQSFLSMAMLPLLTYQKPYRAASTYHLDVLCYVSLAMQFVLEVLVRDSDSLGVSPSTDNPFSGILNAAVGVNAALRYVQPSSTAIVVLLKTSMISLHARCRYVPFVVGAALWLYLSRAAIIVSVSFVYRSIKSVTVACFKRLKSFLAALGGWFSAGIQSCWQCLSRRGARRRPSGDKSAVVQASDDALL